jgi:hypothetical protein
MAPNPAVFQRVANAGTRKAGEEDAPVEPEQPGGLERTNTRAISSSSLMVESEVLHGS